MVCECVEKCCSPVEWWWNDDLLSVPVNFVRGGVLSPVFLLMACCVKCCLKRSDISTVVLGGVLFHDGCCSMMNDELSCDCLLTLTVWWIKFSGCCHRSSPIWCKRCCSLWSAEGAGLFCWCSEMLLLWVCRLQYCSFSSFVQWWKLGACRRGGRIQDNGWRIQYNVSMIQYTLPNHNLSLKLHQLSATNSRTKPLITYIYIYKYTRTITRWSICYHRDIHNHPLHINPLVSHQFSIERIIKSS